MLAALGRIIDDLYQQLRRGGRLKRRIVFVVGNGVHPVSNILNDAQLRAKAGAAMPADEFEAFKWRHFEFARYWTSNALPSLAHCCIHKLVEDGLCTDVITTNYDLYFDTIWQRSSFSIQQNPVLDSDEWPWEDYYTRKKPSGSRRYWKVHGSLSHVAFASAATRPTVHLHRLPRFAISINTTELATAYRIESQAPFMGYEREHYVGTAFSSLADLRGPFLPFIDWTYANERSRFAREIAGAQAVLSNQRAIAAVVLVGFSGYYDDANAGDPWNEELVPALHALAANGFNEVHMAVQQKQFENVARPQYRLMRELNADGRCYVYKRAGDFATELFNNNSRRFPYDYTDYAYRGRWKQWYLNGSEPGHV